MKNEKGMGIIQTIFTVIIILIILSVTICFVIYKYKQVKRDTIKTDMLQVQWKVKDFMDKKLVNKEEKQFIGTKLVEMKDDIILKTLIDNKIILEEELDKFYVLKDEDLAIVGLTITNYKESYFLINYDNYEVIVSKGSKYPEGKILYKLSEIKEMKSK